MPSSVGATKAALTELIARLRPSRVRLVGTIFVLLGAGVFEGATVGLLVPLLAVLVTPTAGARLPVVGDLLNGIPVGSRVTVLGFGILALVGLKNLLMVAGSRLAGALRFRSVTELQRQLLERVMASGVATLERHTSGEITDVFVSEAYRVNRFIDACLVFVQRSIIALSYVGAMLALSWRLTAAAVVVGAVVGFAGERLGRKVQHSGRELSRASGELAREVTEVVGGLRVIRTTATEAHFAKNFGAHSESHAAADVSISYSLALQQGVIESVGVSGAIGLALLAHHLWLATGKLDVPHFLAFGFGLVRLLPALNVVYATQGYITAVVGTVEHTLRWLRLPAYPARPFGSERFPELTDGIRLENVSFSYADGHTPIKNLSCFVPAGKTLAILGPSGTGKSTLVTLLLRLREPSTGKISFDGEDYWRFSAIDFHRAVGLVEQEPFLFNVSIFENVVCGRAGIDRNAVLAALKLVQLGPLIERLPQGLDTVLAERGTTLSGGQRQRIAIARAIVTNPHVLVLDEPTSALDAETEQEVIAAIDAASVGRTTIIVTHRVSAMKHAAYQLDLATGQVTARTSDATLPQPAARAGV